MKRDFLKYAEREPGRLERRADQLSAMAREAKGAAQIRFIMMAAQARHYAADLRAMRAARLRYAMLS